MPLLHKIMLRFYGRNCPQGTEHNKGCQWQRQTDVIKFNRKRKPVPMAVYKCKRCGEMVSI